MYTKRNAFLSARKIVLLALLSLFTFSLHAQEKDAASIKVLYRQLIDAEDAHNVDGVRKILWDSPSTLFVAKTRTPAEGGWAGFWGTDVVMQHFHDILTGSTFRIDPDYNAYKTVFLKPDVAETYVPVKISVSYAGQTPVPKPFLMIVLWVKEGQEWKMATDIAIPIPQ
jgi:hypothetical protein